MHARISSVVKLGILGVGVHEMLVGVDAPGAELCLTTAYQLGPRCAKSTSRLGAGVQREHKLCKLARECYYFCFLTT